MAGAWDEEAEAARLVARDLGGLSHARDPGGGRRAVHDFDVVLADGHVVAVEVTRHTVAAEVENSAVAERKTWRFPALRFDWVVKMTARFKVSETYRRLPSLLAEVEDAGLDRFDLKHDTPTGSAEEALRSIKALGARLLYRLSEADASGGQVILGTAPVVGSTGPDVVAEVAERHANLADNAQKLAAAVADERHLFIWVESAQHQIVAAMAFDVLPARAPALPAHVDVVWVVTAYEICQVWRFRRDRGWQDLGTRRLGHEEA
ncbi:MAG: hypothetical protein ACRDZU_08490 [Acidimicrobiales bacterium]